jgi:hypothetical protein
MMDKYIMLFCDECARDCILRIKPQGVRVPECPMGGEDAIWKKARAFNGIPILPSKERPLRKLRVIKKV